MKKVLLRSLLFASVSFFAFFGLISYATNSFQVVPESDNPSEADATAKELMNVAPEDDFWSKYNAGAEKNDDLGSCLRTGVCSRNSILDLGVYILRFVMQLALVVGAAMLIWSGYTYALVAIGARDKPEEASKAIKNAIIGLFLISISYTLIKLLQMAFLS